MISYNIMLLIWGLSATAARAEFPPLRSRSRCYLSGLWSG